ncbi:MAG: RNA-binding region recognition motif [Myxococcales bacterium]|nr:RNA-binding region recognition motif [Myxococcales bacterium]
MIGCFLFGFAGLMLVSRLVHRHHHGWHGHHGPCGGWGGRYGGGPGGHHGYGYGEGFEGEPGAFGEPSEPWMGGGGMRGLGRGWRGNPFRSGFLARMIADRLDATPAQEKVIRDATDELRETATKLKGEGKKTRADLATAFRKSHFDEVLLGELYARHDRSLEDLRKAFVGMGARIHETLDGKQRERLAEMIESGPGAFGPRWGRGRSWRS